MKNYIVLAKTFGWIWLLLIPVNLVLFVMAVFFQGSWAVFFLFLLLATIAKWAQSWIEYRNSGNDMKEETEKPSRNVKN